jgi:hypothetical protein
MSRPGGYRPSGVLCVAYVAEQWIVASTAAMPREHSGNERSTPTASSRFMRVASVVGGSAPRADRTTAAARMTPPRAEGEPAAWRSSGVTQQALPAIRTR